KKGKVDIELMVSHIGKAWIGDIKDASLEVMKQMVQGFITFHYSKWIGPECQLPWIQISTQRSNYISGKYLSQGVKLWEPSKLQKREAISLLEIWREKQKLDPTKICSFRKWRDA
ncbi:hypothetical protein PAXRUDRAFT_73154, partial [Paxillus rubicundulus Ve08.2h10]